MIIVHISSIHFGYIQLMCNIIVLYSHNILFTLIIIRQSIICWFYLLFVICNFVDNAYMTAVTISPSSVLWSHSLISPVHKFFCTPALFFFDVTALVLAVSLLTYFTSLMYHDVLMIFLTFSVNVAILLCRLAYPMTSTDCLILLSEIDCLCSTYFYSLFFAKLFLFDIVHFSSCLTDLRDIGLCFFIFYDSVITLTMLYQTINYLLILIDF